MRVFAAISILLSLLLCLPAQAVTCSETLNQSPYSSLNRALNWESSWMADQEAKADLYFFSILIDTMRTDTVSQSRLLERLSSLYNISERTALQYLSPMIRTGLISNESGFQITPLGRSTFQNFMSSQNASLAALVYLGFNKFEGQVKPIEAEAQLRRLKALFVLSTKAVLSMQEALKLARAIGAVKAGSSTSNVFDKFFNESPALVANVPTELVSDAARSSIRYLTLSYAGRKYLDNINQAIERAINN